jgi:hypothetical protein
LDIPQGDFRHPGDGLPGWYVDIHSLMFHHLDQSSANPWVMPIGILIYQIQNLAATSPTHSIEFLFGSPFHERLFCDLRQTPTHRDACGFLQNPTHRSIAKSPVGKPGETTCKTRKQIDPRQESIGYTKAVGGCVLRF